MDLPNTQNNEINFSIQQSDDFVDHGQPACLISFQQENNIPNLQEHVSMQVDGMGKRSTHPPASSSKKRAGKRPSIKPNLVGDEDDLQKKMVHREIERQRRQEMTKLYSSLRDLLPLEFVKGNRSISDHMHQAVPYIKQMEENVKGLSMKRDQLKRFLDINDGSSKNHLPNIVSVNFCNEGVEILINSCSIEDGFSLSGVLNALVEEGFNVTSCNFTKVNDRLLHSIQSEANDPSLIDITMLQQKLVFVANNQPNFS